MAQISIDFYCISKSTNLDFEGIAKLLEAKLSLTASNFLGHLGDSCLG